MRDLRDFKLIIMDFDGVIASNTDHRNKIIKKVGILKVIERYMGLENSRKIIDPAIFQLQKKKFDKINLKTNALEIIHYLKDKKKAILSLNSNKIINDFLKKFQIDGEFDKIVGIEDVKYPKPLPNSLISLRKYFNEKREDTVFIGDSWTDEMCGKLAGIKFLNIKDVFKYQLKK